ncbi:MAG: DNA repair protein RadA [Bacteroidales bacterium]|nr:DNA repair protein RadA [Bacteroidales bacterium]MBN2757902.1 DNA repair protein RadA [Bacteroidales bacterium]
MAKVKTTFICQNCGASSPKWIGKCSVCNEWNTYVEETVTKSVGKYQLGIDNDEKVKAVKISDIEYTQEQRIDLQNDELNRVLGGGLVPGSVVLIGGEPGIGKSTLILQVALNLNNLKTLYISGEESLQQIKLRADRIYKGDSNCFVLSETRLEEIFVHIRSVEPDILVFDSIQTIYTSQIESTPGSVSQIRESTMQIMKYAKTYSKPVFLVGHITKDGSLAGPKVLEHIVDTVLQFEGDKNNLYRVLRSTKNRFGSTSELGIFEMVEKGLKEVKNPSELLISDHDENLSGIAIAASMEGMRPFMIEVQSLVSSAAYGTPQRSSTGFDLRRLNMLLAVLEKRAGFKLSVKDVFLNITGGIKVDDPAFDMAIIVAILSSDLDFSISKDICFAGEIGLSGEIRSVQRISQRITEAERLGFKQIFISKYAKFEKQENQKIKIISVSKVGDLLRALFR